MSRYAVKLGEIHIISDEPITEAQRKELAEHLKKGYVQEMLLDNLIEVRVSAVD